MRLAIAVHNSQILTPLIDYTYAVKQEAQMLSTPNGFDVQVYRLPKRFSRNEIEIKRTKFYASRNMLSELMNHYYRW